MEVQLQLATGDEMTPYIAVFIFGLAMFCVGRWLQHRERKPSKWASEMAKVTGLGVNATPEETADQYAELYNAYQELKERGTPQEKKCSLESNMKLKNIPRSAETI